MSDRQKNITASGADHCPLCGRENHCAVAGGAAPESCWCRGAVIDPRALAALPAAERNRRCLCPACAGITRGA